MPNLKKLLKSKTFFIPAFSYIGVIVLLVIGVLLEQRNILPASEFGSLFIWTLIITSLPVFLLYDLLNKVMPNTLDSWVAVVGLVLLFVYHLLIGFGLGFLINFIFRRLKSRKLLDIDKTSELPELKSPKQGLNRRKFLMFLIIFAIIILIIGSGIYLWKKTSGELVTIEGKFYIEQKTRSWGMVNGILISGYDCEEDQDWCKPPNCKLSQKGCPYVNKTVSITGYLSPENCIGGDQCMDVKSIIVKSIKILEEQTTEKQIIIQTNKKVYQQSENIIVTLKNNLAAPIKITDEDYISGGVADLEKKIEDGWQKIDLAVRPHESLKKELLPGESYNYRWDQNTFMTTSPSPMPPGIYRFKFTFEQMGSVYSNEFEIQDSSSSQDCQILEQDIRVTIVAANYCTKDEDCVFTPLRCPLECSVPINKSLLDSMMKKLMQYSNICNNDCEMKCSIEHTGAKCLYNKCIDVQFAPVIVTDKSAYQSTGTIVVTIYNSLEQTLTAPITVFGEGISYEVKINEEWKTTKYIGNSPKGFIECLEDILPHSVCTFELVAPTVPGIYRLKSMLWTQGENRDASVYSREFKVTN